MTPEPDETETGSDAGRRARTVPLGAFVVAVLVALALGILSVFALSTEGGSGDELEDARFAAGRFAERFLSFDDQALDQWKDDVLALATGGFAEEVDEVEEGLRRLIAEAELDARAEVTDIFVGDLERGSIEAVVIYDRELRGSSGSRDESDRYMQLSMLLVDGEWLVDNVIDIATIGASPSPAPAPSTTGPGSSSTSTSPSTTAGEDGEEPAG